MASSVVLDSFLSLLDRHIELHEQRTTTDAATDTPAAPALRLRALRGLAASTSSTAAAAGTGTGADVSPLSALTPLERALVHEIRRRRQQLDDRRRDVEFWEHFYREGPKASSSRARAAELNDRQLDSAIEQRREQHRELQLADRLRREIASSVEHGHTIVSAISTTTPVDTRLDAKRDDSTPSSATDGASYLTTRQLLDQRDDKALEFLRVFEDLNKVRDERFGIKAQVLRTREETSRLLTDIKGARSELTIQRIQTQSQPKSGGAERTQSTTSSEDAGMAARLQRAQATLVETQAKKEMVKGVLRGVILESGRDWTQNKATRKLMLSLEDEEADSEDEFVEDSEEEEREADDEDDDDEEGGEGV